MKLLLNFIIVITISFASCNHNYKKEIHKGVYIEKSELEYSVIFDYNTEYENKFKEVDSIAYNESSQFLLFGKNEVDTIRKWYYISGPPEEFRKSWGGWYDGEFRKYRIIEINDGRNLYANILSCNEIWNREF